MTSDGFLKRVLVAVDDAAFRLSHTPREPQEEWLQGFGDRVRAQWGPLFAPRLEPKDVDGMVSDLVARVRKRRDEMEAAGTGTARGALRAAVRPGNRDFFAHRAIIKTGEYYAA
jgi:hypothetical protein